MNINLIIDVCKSKFYTENKSDSLKYYYNTFIQNHFNKSLFVRQQLYYNQNWT